VEWQQHRKVRCLHCRRGRPAKKTVDRIDGRSSVDFFGFNAMGVGDRVEVTWHRREDRTDEPRQWNGNKPPKL
jgi:hypothetical protein